MEKAAGLKAYMPDRKTPIRHSGKLALAGILTAVVGEIALRRFGPLKGFTNKAAKVGIRFAATLGGVSAVVAAVKFCADLSKIGSSPENS